MIETEQLWEGGYFLQGDREVRIKPDDYANAPALCRTLNPIPIKALQLSRLRFQILNSNNGSYQKFTDEGNCFLIKAGVGGKWFIGLEDKMSDRYLFYVHELQRLFFSLYAQHLRYTGDEITPPAHQTITYKIGQQQKVSSVVMPSTDPRDKNGYTHISVYESIPLSPYLLSVDCTILIRRGNWAIWTIDHEQQPLFEFAGRRWGLILAAGKTVTAADTLAAGKWLKQHLIDNVVK